MNKRPSFQFYPADWLKDPDLQICSMSTIGIWINILCRMWESKPQGKITGTKIQLRLLSGCSENDFERFIEEIKTHKFGDVTYCHEIITVTNRRMWGQEEQREEWRNRQRKRREKGLGRPKSWTAIRRNILNRDKEKCAYCGKKAEGVDHIIPRAKGGNEEYSNLVACCNKCNATKNDRSLQKANMKFDNNFDLKVILQNHGFTELSQDNHAPSSSSSSTSKNYVTIFDSVRKKYPGKKRGIDTEWKNFRKKHSDWKDIIPLLTPAVENCMNNWRQTEMRFIPHFATWINQRRWEMVDGCEITPEEKEKREQKTLAKKRDEIRLEDGGFFEGKSIEELKAMLHRPGYVTRRWLIMEILQKKGSEL